MPVFHGYFVAEVELGLVTAPGGVIFDSSGRVHSGGRKSVTGRVAIGCFKLGTDCFRLAADCFELAAG